jgi:hypothetical protein
MEAYISLRAVAVSSGLSVRTLREPGSLGPDPAMITELAIAGRGTDPFAAATGTWR